jgi:hypoxanthine phosphoribosyltransferase
MHQNLPKRYITADEQLLDSYRLAMQVWQSGFRPDYIVGLWRGGSPVGIVVQDCLDWLGHPTDHISLRTSYRGLPSYERMIDCADEIRVHGTQYLWEKMNREDRLLIVDDVQSSGLNIQAVIRRLEQKLRRNMPREVRVAVTWNRPASNRSGRQPDYCVHETDEWLVLPYELQGLSEDEIIRHKPFVHELAEWALGRRDDEPD